MKRKSCRDGQKVRTRDNNQSVRQSQKKKRTEQNDPLYSGNTYELNITVHCEACIPSKKLLTCSASKADSKRTTKIDCLNLELSNIYQYFIRYTNFLYLATTTGTIADEVESSGFLDSYRSFKPAAKIALPTLTATTTDTFSQLYVLFKLSQISVFIVVVFLFFLYSAG